MNFQSRGRPLSDQGMDMVCEILGVNDAEVWAILTVETRGFGYFTDRRPQILFERHIFHRFTCETCIVEDEAICSPHPGGYCGGEDEYRRLQAAMQIDQHLALQSASWGIAQIMGFNYAAAGFSTVEDMIEKMVENEDEQLLGMANFIKNSQLTLALQRRNWSAFARGYNGEDYKRNEYDTRLAAAHAKYSITLPDLTLRTAQAALTYLGISPGPIDGLRGRRTRAALVEFQKRAGLSCSGELDAETELQLHQQAFA